MTSRREISKTYKERTRVGCVYTITNTASGKYLLDFAADVTSVRNRFHFAVTMNSAVHPKLRADWAASGAAAFKFDILEELEQGPTQSDDDFMTDLKALEQMLHATLDASKEY